MFMRLSVFLLLLVTVYHCRQKTAPDYFQAGLKAYKQYRYQRAIERFQAAIQLDANYKSAYFKLYDAYKESKQLGLAERDFKRLQQAHPASSYPVYFLSRIYQADKRFLRAQQALKTGVRLWPPFAESFAMLAQSSKELQNADLVEAFFAKMLSERPGDPYVYYGLAVLQQMRLHPQAALRQLEYALQIKPGFPAAMALKARIFRDMGRYEQAITVADSALRRQNILNDPDLRSTFLLSRASNHWYMGTYKAALADLQAALKYSQINANVGNQLKCLNILGLIYRSTNENSQALKYFKSALRLINKRGYETYKGVILANLGDVCLNLAQYDSSLSYYAKALKILKANKDIRNSAATLGAMAAAYSMRGEYSQAVRLGKTAIAEYKKLGDKSGQGIELINMAAIYVERAHYAKALELLQQALLLIRGIKEKNSEQICLGLIGTTYLKLGNYKQALTYLKTSRKIAARIGSQADEASVLGNLATVSLALGDTSTALQNLNKALSLQQKMDDRRNAAISCNNIGKIYSRRKNYQKAFVYLRRAVKMQRQMGDKFNLSHTLNNLADLNYQLNDLAMAAKLHGRALQIADSLKAAESTATAHYGLARILFAQGRLPKSIFHYKKAIDTVEGMRATLTKNEFKESFLEDKIDIYKGLIDVFYSLYERGGNTQYADSALYYMEKGKARTLFDLLAEAGGKIKKSPLTPLTKLRDIYRSAFDGEEALILEYSLTAGHNYLWALAPGHIRFYKLKQNAQLQSAVTSYIRLISAPPQPGLDLAQQGKRLYDLLLKPVRTQLKHCTKLVVIPDGILYYLPFGTLINSINTGTPSYLIETHQISYAPSLSIMDVLSARKIAGRKTEGFIAFADPRWAGKQEMGGQMEKTLIAMRGFDLQPLPYSAKEVQKIARLLPKNKARLFLGKMASEKNVKSAELKRYRWVHFATHVLIDETLPERSCIALAQPADSSEDGFLKIDEICALHLNADLVTLSGCQSAKGRLTRAEGVLGLTRAFFYAGARSLLVSQWQVNDYTTARFMEKFYRYLQAGGSKSGALQKTKVDFIKGAIAKNRHPYFWAPFILTGNSD